MSGYCVPRVLIKAKRTGFLLTNVENQRDFSPSTGHISDKIPKQRYMSCGARFNLCAKFLQTHPKCVTGGCADEVQTLTEAL